MSHHDEPVTVSVNGADNVGKTTHLRWLAGATTGANLLGTVDRWNPRWQQVAAGDFARWWFLDSTTAEHVDLVLGSHQQRRRASAPLGLEDRGRPMLLAMCAATAAVKNGHAPLRALEIVAERAEHFPTAPRHEIHVLLRHHDTGPQDEAEWALRRDSHSPSPWYRDYQWALAEIVEHQRRNGEYHLMLVRGHQPIVPLQRELRDHLAALGLPVRPLPEEPLRHVWVLGGLSECGKSTVGELLRDEHGTTRLKIGYLLEVAAARAGVHDPYESWSEPVQAEYLVEELLRFSETCHSPCVSLESAHRFASTQHVKRLLGERCRLVYVHADRTVRSTRTCEDTAHLQERDTIKIERGAERLATIADHVIDNNRPLSALKLSLTHLVTSTVQPRGAPPAWTPRTNRSWLAAVTRQLVDDEVALVLATGSTGRQHWLSECSDFDLLVVRDHLPVAWLRRVWNELRTSTDTHIGLSCFTTADLEAIVVPPRVLNALRTAVDGTGVLYHRDDYRLPLPPHAASDRASRGELGAVLMTTRRLLAAASPNLREIRKHLVLLTKILLRSDGHETDVDTEVLAAARRHHPSLDLDLPPTADLLDTVLDSPPGQRLLTTADRLLTYCDHLHGSGKDTHRDFTTVEHRLLPSTTDHQARSRGEHP